MVPVGENVLTPELYETVTPARFLEPRAKLLEAPLVCRLARLGDVLSLQETGEENLERVCGAATWLVVRVVVSVVSMFPTSLPGVGLVVVLYTISGRECQVKRHVEVCKHRP